ncbi:TIGR03067 domain-containing protein, partial [Candidatus Woesearchaeota archaeon]|nr:TIGR03067 domain-containing protein [Candidatus Woesearchaeota archaeon]
MSTILVCRDKRKRYTRIFVPLLLGTFLLAMNAFGEGKEALQGTWAFIAYEAEGVSIPEEQITAAKLQVAFLGDKMIQKCDGNVLSEATYKVEDNRTPKTIDSFTTNGTEKGIYLLEGDILTICMSKSGFPRPLNFATKVGSKQMLFRLQRILPNQTFSPVASFTDTDRIFKESSKAVVVVTAYDEKGNPVNRGSGFIVRADGAVVTNYHVIGMASDIKVTAGDKVLDVEGLIFSDEKNDLVILKAKARNMPVVKLGVVGKANIGE